MSFISANVKICNKECKLIAYKSLVRSILEYGSFVWDPYLVKDIDKLESVQCKAVRFICNDFRSRHQGAVTNMLSSCDLPTLEERRKNNRLPVVYFQLHVNLD